MIAFKINKFINFSIVQVILGELPVISGNVEINGVISYASQEPWLFSASIRQNILFGLPYDKERYKIVVKKCALERDFTLFPYGDRTIVGERGASLSGGQKARISLARAVYRKADIYLLEDPLSAVDSHVGKHLFEQCIRDFLKGKIVILITHQLQYLQQADQIVIVEHGKAMATGSYNQLRRSALDFALLLTKNEEEEEEKSKQISRSESLSHHRRNSESSLVSVENNAKENNMQTSEASSGGSISLSVSIFISPILRNHT